MGLERSGASHTEIAPLSRSKKFSGQKCLVMKKRNARSRDFLEVTPKRNLQWETDDEGLTVLIVPRFTNPLAVKWLVPRLARPDFKLKLDPLGSFVWDQCDGVTPVSAIAEKMRQKFGLTAEPVYERVTAFVSRLQRERFLVLMDKSDRP
jgi:hypothetical protein